MKTNLRLVLGASLACVSIDALAATVCFADRGLCSRPHHDMQGCWVDRRDVALRNYCGGSDPLQLRIVGKPASRGSCGITVIDVTCPSGTNQSAVAPPPPPKAPEVPAAAFIQSADFGDCNQSASARRFGFRNTHTSSAIKITFEVTSTIGTKTSSYIDSKVLRPGAGDWYICSYSPPTLGSPAGQIKSISLTGAAFL
jgi:hypothetical protein